MVTRCLPRAETAALELTQDFKGFRLFGVWPLALPYHVIMLHRSFLAKAAARAQAMAIETRLAMNPLQLDPIRHSSVRSILTTLDLLLAPFRATIIFLRSADCESSVSN